MNSLLLHDKASRRRDELRWHLVVTAMTLGGALLRIRFLGQPVRNDEAFTFVHYASRPLHEALSDYSFPNNHLLHTLLVHVTFRSFGAHPWALRLPALLAGVAIIPATYALGRRLYDETTGVVAAALVATSSALIEFSTNARGYTLVVLATVLCALAAAPQRRTPGPARWILFAVAGALGLYTIPLMLLPLTGVAIWAAVSAMIVRRRLSLARYLALLAAAFAVACALALALYVPVIVHGDWHKLVGNSWIAARHWSHFLRRARQDLASIRLEWFRDVPFVAAVALALAAIYALILDARRPTFITPFVVLVVVTLVFLAFRRPRAGLVARILLFLLPLYLLASAAGIARLLSRIRRFSLTVSVALVIAGGLGTNVLVAKTVLTSAQTGFAPEAAAVASWLSHDAPPHYRVISFGVIFHPIQYYLLADGYSLDAFGPPAPQDRTFLLVVDRSEGQTPQQYVNNLQQQAAGHLDLLRHFRTVDLYEFTR